jgi:hypothetical protein
MGSAPWSSALTPSRIGSTAPRYARSDELDTPALETPELDATVLGTPDDAHADTNSAATPPTISEAFVEIPHAWRIPRCGNRSRGYT